MLNDENAAPALVSTPPPWTDDPFVAMAAAFRRRVADLKQLAMLRATGPDALRQHAGALDIMDGAVRRSGRCWPLKRRPPP